MSNAHTVVPVEASKALMMKRAEARDYNARLLGPIVEGAIAYLRLQKVEANDTLRVLLEYLKARAAGTELVATSERHNDWVADKTVFAPIVKSIVKDMPSEDDVIHAFIAKVEAAMKAIEAES